MRKCDEDADDAIEQAEDLLRRLRRLPPGAADFVESVTGIVSGIKLWCEDTGQATVRQMGALYNIERGVRDREREGRK